MKTRERILVCALDLFNEHGAPNVTSLDIANELDISPGNLYYHFKGKEALLEELLENFLGETRGLLLPGEEPATLVPEDYWLFLHLLFEAVVLYRFLFRDLSNLMGRHGFIEHGMQLWLSALRRRLDLQFTALQKKGNLLTDEKSKQCLLDAVCQTLIFWLDYQRIAHHEGQENLNLGVVQVLGLMLPWLDTVSREWMEALMERYE